MVDAPDSSPPPASDPGAPADEVDAQQSSDEEEDQFTDARSGPLSPEGSPPTSQPPVESISQRSAGQIEAPRQSDGDGSSDNGSADADRNAPTPTPASDLHPSPTAAEDDDDDAPASSPDALPADDDFGDDFDDFEEGAQDAGFDHFDDDDFHQPPPDSPATPAQPPAETMPLPFPIPNLDHLDRDQLLSAAAPYLSALFPSPEFDFPPPSSLPAKPPVFLTPRSAALWSQLVAPPPLSPPDWIRSRTRRLFLVSLGVPVDLDEILPASKQKKLVLPSPVVPVASPRSSTDARFSGSHPRHPPAGSPASASAAPQSPEPGPSSRRGAPPRPDLDLVAARYLCTTTDEALSGMTDQELEQHVAKLEAMQEAAKEALDYWQCRTDEMIGDREAFEGVIENLVKHARKARK